MRAFSIYKISLIASLSLLLSACTSSPPTPPKPTPPPPPKSSSFDSGRVNFQVQFGAISIQHRVFAVFVMPQQTQTIQVKHAFDKRSFTLKNTGGKLSSSDRHLWTWQAPSKPGIYPITIQANTGESIQLNAFVMTPLKEIKQGKIKGYTIGQYPKKALRDLTIYQTPQGFIEVTQANENTWIAPHFTLKQFLCKQNQGYPKYLVLREKLVVKLEMLLEHVNQHGIRAATFHVMSGYRTPHYNASLGNTTYSRHMWGDAADILIDHFPKDGHMDDLNRDGRIDKTDAETLAELVEQFENRYRFAGMIGGLGRYEKNHAHGPFIHVDARGFRARWDG